MNILFIHQNFPGQYRHLAAALAMEPSHQVVAIGEKNSNQAKIDNVRYVWYEKPRGASASTHHYIRGLEAHIRRGQAIIPALEMLKKNRFLPDVICVHPGWGEGLFLKEFYPDVPVIGYFEFYYHGRGVDVGFDPEFPSTINDMARVRVKNATNLLSLEACDYGISPTHWQKSQFPEAFQDKIAVIHEGIDTDTVRGNPEIRINFENKGMTLSRESEVITFVNRNLEPYRGFHVFMRSLPKILASRPNAHVLILGGDEVSYGKRPSEGMTYRQTYLSEVDIDLSRVHFLGRIPYEHFLAVLQVSSVHVYLTYPFVLSWSMLEAMSCGCRLVASATPPVMEVIRDGVNGLLVDFFSPEEIAAKVIDVLTNPGRFEDMRQNARRTIVEKYDSKRVCLPAQVEYIKKVSSEQGA
jgi:glycosyltransferase involved in cell wall biosynthesis